MLWTANPVIDAERYYDTLPETVGTCPFCERIVQKGNRWHDGDDYIRGKRGAVAHTDCFERCMDQEFYLKNRPLLDEEEEEALEELSLKLGRFA